MPTRSDPAASAMATIPSSAAGDPLVRVYTLVAALRRRWRVWCATALVAMVLGGLFFIAKPPVWTATTEILVRRPATTQADPARQMETDVKTAESDAVLKGATARLPRGTLIDYSVESLSNDILRVTARGADRSAALRSAEALANEFLRFRADQVALEAKAYGAVLQQQADPLTAKIEALNTQIAAAPPSAVGAQSGLTSLLNSRDQLESRLAAIQQQSTDAGVAAAVATQISRALGPADAKAPPKLSLLVVDLLAGLIGGAAAGGGWVVFGAIVTDRARRREDVMAALHAPVAVSVASVADPHRFRGRSVRVDVGRLQRRHGNPGRDVTLMVGHLRRALAASGTAKPAVLVVSVDSDWSAGPVVAEAAAQLRAEGNDILMADFSNAGALATLLRATGPLTTVNAGPPASKLWTGSKSPAFNARVDQWLKLHDLGQEADIILVLATLDPAVGAGHLVELASTAVVVATAGRSTATALRSAARMIRAEGIVLHSAMLVGADRLDETSGSLPGRASAPTDPRALQQNR